MGIYDNIKKIADEKKITIYRLEKETGISNGAIARWNDAVPSSVNLIKVAIYLGTQVEMLVDLDKTKHNQKVGE